MSNFVFLSLALTFAFSVAQGHEVRLEAGVYQTNSNRFSIPNPGGSGVFVQNKAPSAYGRLQGQLQIFENGFLKFVVAPLTAKYSQISDTPVLFNGATFAALSPVDVTFKFNSYRLGYIHRFGLSESFQLQAGVIGKIREAQIALSSGAVNSEYNDLGFVPLLNLGFRTKIGGPWELRFDLDGAAAPQGRALDGALEVFYQIQQTGTGISGGVRVLEGGAENSKVYTFTLIQYGFLAFTQFF